MQIAITVDDLPRHGDTTSEYSRYKITQNLVQVFLNNQIPSVTGFVNGISIERYTDDAKILELWVSKGNSLGNHTYSHLDLNKVPINEYISDIEKNEPILSSFQTKYQTFRYPYLATGRTKNKQQYVKEYLVSKGYKIAPVTIDFFDFLWNTPICKCIANKDNQSLKVLKQLYVELAIQKIKEANQITKKIFQSKIKHILLLHIGLATSLFFEEVILFCRSMGCNFIDLQTALEDPVFETESTKFCLKSGFNFLQAMADIKKIKNYFDFSEVRRQIDRFGYSLPSIISAEVY